MTDGNLASLATALASLDQHRKALLAVLDTLKSQSATIASMSERIDMLEANVNASQSHPQASGDNACVDGGTRGDTAY
jgi:ABC-type transporter Mla subunit MlaD